MSNKQINLLHLDYSVVQQCMHCGLCLPVCPTYEATKLERNSPRGRISLIRAVADGRMKITTSFGQEMYFCLGCLACTSACPAGVDYANLFEVARAEIEASKVLVKPKRQLIRWLTLKCIFTRPRLLHFVGWLLHLYQVSGMQWLLRASRLIALLPRGLRRLESLTPNVRWPFSGALIEEREIPKHRRYRVGLLTGCVQDLIYPKVNRDTADVLLAHDCEVLTPRMQFCCGSIHAHNGELDLAREMARRNIIAMERLIGSLDRVDAIISNAGGCGSHLKDYQHLLQDDPSFAGRAAVWTAKIRDIQEWLVSIGLQGSLTRAEKERVTYHESCHLCHGQKVSQSPRKLLQAIPGLEFVELPEANWCCGSAGVYNITQPEMSKKLLDRKVAHIESTGATIVASANPGCSLQLETGLRQAGSCAKVVHPVSLLAAALRQTGV